MSDRSAAVAQERERRQTYTDRVAALFLAHPLRWINSRQLEQTGGRNAWRTRVSECRTARGMWIENRVLYLKRRGRTVSLQSVYCYRPFTPLGRAADVPVDQPSFW